MKERINHLLSLQYPTRQDMRDCMQLQKEHIAELEEKLKSDNSDYAKCILCADDLMNMLYPEKQNSLIRLAVEKMIVKHFA